MESLTCAEIGVLLGSYTQGERRLSIVTDPIYIGALIIFDLYEHKLIDLYVRVSGKSISIRSTDPKYFPLFDKAGSLDIARALLIVPLV